MPFRKLFLIRRKLLYFALGTTGLCAVVQAQTELASSIDKQISIQTVAMLRMLDNVGDIYAQQLNQRLTELLRRDPQWTLSSTELNSGPALIELEESPTLVRSAKGKLEVDAIISGAVIKNPSGLSLQLDLFSARDGKLLAQAKYFSREVFELNELKDKLNQLYSKLKRQIPYSGWIVSRRGNLVTLNLGSQQGVRINQDFTVVLIVNLRRHPRFNFVTGADREVLGKVRVQQVDENLSFGTIIFERDDSPVVVGNKVISQEWIEHPESGVDLDNHLITDVQEPLAFGKNPKEWKPLPIPSIGKVEAMAGLANYSISNSLATSGGLSSGNAMSPGVRLAGEIWITPSLFSQIEIKESIFSIGNPGNSAPGRLNVALTQTTLIGGYNFRFSEDFFGPKMHLGGGYTQFHSQIDQSNPLTSFTSQTYSGLVVQVGGSFPVETESGLPISLGGDINLELLPSLTESPVDSGSSSNTVINFSGYFEYAYSTHTKFKAILSYDSFSSSFSGLGTRGQTASSSSQNIIGLMAGIEYLF